MTIEDVKREYEEKMGVYRALSSVQDVEIYYPIMQYTAHTAALNYQ